MQDGFAKVLFLPTESMNLEDVESSGGGKVTRNTK